MNNNTGQISTKKKRILMPDGSWKYFEGKRQVVPTKSPEQKIQERKEAEAKGKVLEDGSIELEGEAKVEEKVEEESGLSAEDIEKVKSGMSIPEMKALAKKKGLKVPSKLKKSADIKDFLVGDSSEEDSL